MKQRRMKQMNRSVTSRAWALAMMGGAAVAITVQSSAATLYVSQTSTNPSPPYSTWDTAAHDIQEAVDAANDSDTVLVAPDQYDLTNQVTVTKAITLRSTMGPDQTILNALNNIKCLWISNSLAVAEGFSFRLPSSSSIEGPAAVMTGGTIQSCIFSNSYYHGSVSMTGGVLSNCIVAYEATFIPTRKPGVYCDSGLVTDCQIYHIEGFSGGGYDSVGIAIQLINGQLRNSLVWGGYEGGGGGAAVDAVSSSIVGCSIVHNGTSGKGGGAHLNSCFMDRCLVGYNSCAALGPGGGGIFETNSIIRDSLIVGNTAAADGAEPGMGAYGGGVYMQGGALLNCTVSGNAAFSCPDNYNAQGHGAGIYVESGGLTNCIVFANYFYGCTNSEENWFNVGTGVFDHCCTAPDPGGSGNIVQDPQFVDPANGDYHLASSSPCLGAGVVQPWMTDAFDLDGNPRTSNGYVDLGAYQSEFRPTPLQQVESLIGEVNDLVQQGVLSQGEGNSLIARLQAAEDSINDGRDSAACEQVDGFIHQVESLVRRGALAQVQGRSLMDAAGDIQAALGCR